MGYIKYKALFKMILEGVIILSFVLITPLSYGQFSRSMRQIPIGNSDYNGFARMDKVFYNMPLGDGREADFFFKFTSDPRMEPKYMGMYWSIPFFDTKVYKTAEEIFPLCKFKHVLPVSAVKNINVDTLMNLLYDELPENVMQYDEDLITTQPEKFLISEYIREQIFMRLRNEVPHDTLVYVEDYSDKSKSMEINAIIYVNRESQKGIVIGEGGSMLKTIGTAARKNLESFFEKKVRLNLWVKVKENWVARPEYLDMQGL